MEVDGYDKEQMALPFILIVGSMGIYSNYKRRLHRCTQEGVTMTKTEKLKYGIAGLTILSLGVIAAGKMVVGPNHRGFRDGVSSSLGKGKIPNLPGRSGSIRGGPFSQQWILENPPRQARMEAMMREGKLAPQGAVDRREITKGRFMEPIPLDEGKQERGGSEAPLYRERESYPATLAYGWTAMLLATLPGLYYTFPF